MSAKKATPQKPAAPITSFFAKAPSPSQHAAVGMKGAAMAEGDKATVKQIEDLFMIADKSDQ